MAKHGYNVIWNGFFGTCAGSGHLPFEVSKDLIAVGVAQVTAQIAAVDKQCTEQMLNQGPEVMERNANMKGRPWQRKTLKLTGERTGLHFMYGAKNDAELVQHFNKRYVAYLRGTILEMEKCREWLHKRAAEWKPAELRAL